MDKRGIFWTGKKHTPEAIEKMRQSHKGFVPWNKGKTGYKLKMVFSKKGKHYSPETEFKKGYKPANWIEDRSLLKKYDDRRSDGLYKMWRKDVFKRDEWKCRISNESCRGRIEAHHILDWTNYLELRYEINNGITLCHAHHPMGRAKEQLLVPIFQELVSQMN